MTTLLIIIASLAAAYLATRLSRHEPFRLADLVTAGFGALVGLAMVEYRIGARSTSDLGLALLFACGLTIGLIALRRPSLRD